MRNVEDLLRAADPLRHEPPEKAEDRDAIRRTVLAAASGAEPNGRRFATLRASVALIVVVVVFIGVGARFWPRGTTEVSAAVRFEVRLAEAQFAPGLREARVVGSNRTIYLHQEIVATNEDIAQSDVVEGDAPSRFWIRVAFTSAGAAKMQRATAGHLGAPVAVLIDGEVVLAPTLRSPISTSAVISGDYTKAEADRIVRGMSVR